MHIELRQLGRKPRPLDGWSVPTPPEWTEGDGGITLRELIGRVVRSELAAFRIRANGRRLVRALTAGEIADGAARGRVDPGGRDVSDDVDPDTAVGAALQGFEDGLYLVIVDGAEQRNLDSQVYLTDDSRLVFLRLTFLAGA